jgi:alpha-ketoglutarate-dependent taurine dioxygenase
MMVEINSLVNSNIKVIYSNNCQDILSLSVEKIKELFKLNGLLIFRGFGVNHKQMKAFSEQFSSRFIGDTGRTIVNLNDGFVRLVDPEMHDIGPHCEHAHTPYRVDAIWFCCGVPAAHGGETLFWDGVRVWEELSEELKQLFVSKKLCFFNHYSANQWKYFLGSGATINDAKRALDGLEGVNYRFGKEQSLSIEYVCSAVVKTKYSHQDAFANSLLNLYTSTEENVKFEDGSLIPDTVIYEIKKVTDRLTEAIQWQAGDLVMVDNSRFMHGRRAFNDNRRKIFVILSELSF